MDLRILPLFTAISLLLLRWAFPDELDETQSNSAGGVLSSAATQQGCLWICVAALVLLLGFIWWLIERMDMEYQEENPGNALQVVTMPYVRSMIVLDLLVNEVLDELLRKCQELSKKDFSPVLQTPLRLRWGSEDSSHLKFFGICCLVVSMKAPLGHSFYLEPGTIRQPQHRKVRVELECVCEKEQLDGDMLCFLHHPKELLSRKQPPSLLDTLCTSSYLDPVKTSSWFKELVKTSWEALPDAKGFSLAALSTNRFCRLELAYMAYVTLVVDMQLAVDED